MASGALEMVEFDYFFSGMNFHKECSIFGQRSRTRLDLHMVKCILTHLGTHLFKPLCGGDASERCRSVEPLLRRLVELDVDALLAAGAPKSPRDKVMIYDP